MKKCKKCGAIQSDDRTMCVDCGALLGESLSEAEAARAEAAFADKIDTMGDRMEDFHVPVHERVLGIVSIVLAVLLLVSAWVNGARLSEIDRKLNDRAGGSLPDVLMEVGGGTDTQCYFWNGELIEADAATAAAIAQSESLERALLYGLFGVVFFGMAAALFLIPKLVWYLATIRYRLWFDHDASPSFFALGVYKVLKYTLFVLGCLALIAAASNMF